MDILLYSPEDQDDLASGLAQALPEATIHVWREPASTGASGEVALPPCDYAVLWAPPASLFDNQDRLKAIFALGAGVDSLMRCPGLPAEVPVIRIEDAGMADQMIEYALYAALQRLRRFDQYRRFSAEGNWQPLSFTARKDVRVGILGLGELGRRVAGALASFGFSVSAWSRSEKQADGILCRHGPDGLDAVLAASDVLVVLLPLTDATRGLLDHRALSLLSEGACLVNLARGPLIVDADLLALLESGHIGYAFLDVFSVEPLPPGHPYWRHPRVCVTPHIAAVIPPSESVAQISGKIRALEAGNKVSGVVERGKGY
ncbi:MAG: glyoxylate/hydroxypyruvate reductase A [Spirochaetia bacterium]|jgi:glyoxylate/hydroxypyruvate reductase A|nr:glyoxylate/hydroxypyruvate reductase A [Spirochaetia bacterium]